MERSGEAATMVKKMKELRVARIRTLTEKPILS